MSKPFEIFAVTLPGLEDALQQEAVEAGFPKAVVVPGGVTFMGHWTTVWKANLRLRGATRILARIGQFRVFHLAELDRKALEFPWKETFAPGVAIRVDVTCKSSKIYHEGAALERIERAINTVLRAPVTRDADVTLKVRIENNMCTLSVDTSGEPLHKRGFKQFVGKAPIRETMAALFLRQCGYAGQEPVLDPMCGSGTFLLEAAAMATGQTPVRSRDFAFQKLGSFHKDRWAALKREIADTPTDLRFYGSDRDAGAIEGARQNAEKAGFADNMTFTHQAFSDVVRPEGPPGLIMINPPYGDRIGDKKKLFGLYGSLGTVLMERFSGWRVGMITSDRQLAQTTKLPFLKPASPVPHGGIRITLYQTKPLP